MMLSRTRNLRGPFRSLRIRGRAGWVWCGHLWAVEYALREEATQLRDMAAHEPLNIELRADLLDLADKYVQAAPEAPWRPSDEEAPVVVPPAIDAKTRRRGIRRVLRRRRAPDCFSAQCFKHRGAGVHSGATDAIGLLSNKIAVSESET
jgi:hypothetical protein